MAEKEFTIEEENMFWLQIMGDKARLISKELYTQEKDLVLQAENFITLFDGLLSKARQTAANLNEQAYRSVQDFRKYVLGLIRTQISEKTIIGISPEYLSVYVNETEMYLNILSADMNGTVYTVSGMDVIIVWMINAYMGAVHLEDNIGVSYVELKQKAQDFSHAFLVLYLRAYILNGFMRSGLKSFPALGELYNDVAAKITDYAEYLVDMIRLMQNRKMLGTLSMLEVDDIYRIICYIMTKLASVSNIKPPFCNPSALRME